MPRGVSLYDEAALQRRLLTPRMLASATLLAEFDLSQRDTVQPGANLAVVSSDRSKTATSDGANAAGFAPTGINGLPAISYTVGASHLDTASFAQGGAWTVFTVVQPNALSGLQNLVDGDTTASPRVAQYLRLSGSTVQAITFDSAGNAYTAQTAAAAAGSVMIIGATRSATLLSVSVNGAAAGTIALSGTPASGTQALRLGDTLASGTSSGNQFLGVQGAALYFSGALSAIDFEACFGILAWRFRAQTVLTATNRYRNRPPLIGV